MELNREAVLLQNEMRKFCREVVLDKVDEFDKKGILPSAHIQRLAAMGMLGATVPENFGGTALDTIGLIVTLEEISKVDPSIALVVAVHNVFFTYPILKYASEEQRKRYLPKTASGEAVGGFAEWATNEITVKSSGDEYRLGGRNPLLLNGEAGGPFILMAARPDSGDLMTFIIDAKVSGVERVKNGRIIGVKAAGISEVILKDYAADKAQVVGNEKTGGEIFADVINFGRLAFSAIALGISQGALENAIKYGKERVQFSEPIINFGMVREKIADMSTKIEALRLLVYEAARQRDVGQDYRRTAAMARNFGSQAVAEITTSAIQIYGGYGYMKDYPVERYFRDAQVIRVLGSTSVQDKEFVVKQTI